MASTLDFGYLMTPPGMLNIGEIFALIGALISVSFTSRLYCELVDNLGEVYPDLYTTAVRGTFQAFAVLCITVTIVIIIVHIYGARYSGQYFSYLNKLCMVINIIQALMMISIGICAALWEDKLRRTPAVIRRGYYSYEYHDVFREPTLAWPGAAAAAATFAFVAGILYILEASSRPMLSTGASLVPTRIMDRPKYIVPSQSVATQRSPVINVSGDRIIPIEVTTSNPQQQYRV